MRQHQIMIVLKALAVVVVSNLKSSAGGLLVFEDFGPFSFVGGIRLDYVSPQI